MQQGWQKYVVGLGLALCVLSPGLDMLGLSSPGFSRGQGLILAFGLALVLIGFLGKRSLAVYQGLGVIFLNTLLFILLIELAAGAYSWLISGEDEGPAASTPSRLSIPYYAEQDWAPAYWSEFSNSDKYDYAPYVVWRRPPYQGQTINVDANLHRLTPGADCRPGAFTVWMFGGSTLWGTGAPDHLTIPAYVQAALMAQISGPVCVVNFGQSAYVAEQAWVELMLQLKAGGRPDMVIFYDGVNDVYAAYQSGRAGLHQNYAFVAGIFEGQAAPPPWYESLSAEARANTYSGRLFERTFGQNLETEGDIILPSYTPAQKQVMAEGVRQIYQETIAMVAALEAVYGYEALFFWQPVSMVGDKPLTANERAIIARLDPQLVELYRLTYTLMAEEGAINTPDFYNLRGIFDTEAAELWIDLFHITPVGNEQVAAAMLAQMAPYLPN
jgi:lysophospholipase L1-like esterase